VERVRAGMSDLSQELATQAILRTKSSPHDQLTNLTPREIETLTLLSQGKPYGLIADELEVSYRTVVDITHRLSSTLANFSSSSAAWDAEHRIVLDDVVGTLKHEFHAAEVAKGAPATMDVGPIKQLETIRIGDGAQPGDGI
jgi:hypothetical protein